MKKNQVIASIFAAMHVSAFSAELIRLGVSLPLTGPLAVNAKQFHEGARVCFEAVNEKGGIRGRKIEMVTLDDQFDTTKVLENAKTLLKQDVVALFGFMGTPGIMEMVKFTNENKVPLIGAVSGSPAVKDPRNRYVFVIRASFLQEASSAVDIGVITGVKEWGVVYQEDGTGKAALEGVRSSLEKNGLKTKMESSFVGAKPDFAATLEKIAASKPTALIFGGNAAALASFVNFAKERNVTLPNITVLSVISPEIAMKLLGDNAAGLRFTQPMPYPFTTGTETATAYSLAAKMFSPDPVSFIGMEGCLSAKLMTRVLQLTPNFSPEGMVSTLETMSNFPLTREFIIKFGPSDRSGSGFVDTLMIGRNGKVVR